MRHLISLTVLTMFATVGVRAAPPPSPQNNLHRSLERKCQDGVGVACFRYGTILTASKSKADIRKGGILIRRACTLAYAPACTQRSATTTAKVVKDTQTKIDGNGNVCLGSEILKTAKWTDDGRSIASIHDGSILDTAGLEAGDEIVSVNGEAYKFNDQIAKAFDKGGAVVNVLRNGRESSIMVNCNQTKLQDPDQSP